MRRVKVIVDNTINSETYKTWRNTIMNNMISVFEDMGLEKTVFTGYANKYWRPAFGEYIWID